MLPFRWLCTYTSVKSMMMIMPYLLLKEGINNIHPGVQKYIM
jgi:hypothetical protein